MKVNLFASQQGENSLQEPLKVDVGNKTEFKVKASHLIKCSYCLAGIFAVGVSLSFFLIDFHHGYLLSPWVIFIVSAILMASLVAVIVFVVLAVLALTHYGVKWRDALKTSEDSSVAV